MVLQNELESLITEERNSLTKDLDLLNTLDLVTKIQAEDAQVALAVQKAIPAIAKAVDLIVGGLRKEGRLIYFGAGTSGRLGILDASECPPTFGVDLGLVSGYIAGGKTAVFQTVEGAEDHEELGEKDVIAAKIKANDIVCGITASGRTPYVIGALRKAKERGAYTVGVINNKVEKANILSSLCDVTIVLITGPEALTGSTRMKAGSAQKMVLNLLTTCSMVRLGKVYENLMVDLTPTNYKLKQRASAIIALVCSVPRSIAEEALIAANNNAKTAILMTKKDISLSQAQRLLTKNKDSLRLALQDNS
jgi:N-acetylmuramic acid 6-phosphate etherase